MSDDPNRTDGPRAGEPPHGSSTGEHDPYGHDPYASDPYGSRAGDRSYAGGFGGYGQSAGYGGGAGSRLFDDLARLVTDAAGATQGVRREVETVMRAQAESVLSRLDVVRRDEFEAMAEVARRARTEADALRARVEALEARLGGSDREKN